MTRGAGTTSSRCAALIVVALAGLAPARGQDTAWDDGPRRPAPAPAGAPFPRPLAPVQDDGPVPVSIDVDPGQALARELAALAEARRHGEMARAARGRALDPLVRARWVRDPWGGAALLGAQEAARRALAALPRELRAAARPTWDLELEASGLLARGDDAAARAALSAYPEATAAPDLARRLGERCLERGEVEAALLYFRRALALDPPADVARVLRARALALAARPGGPLGAPLPPPQPLGLVWARGGAEPPLAAACDEAHVYVAHPDRLLALDRRDGRLRWAKDDIALDEGVARLALGHEALLLVERGALRAFAPLDGAPRWSVTLEALRGAGGAEDPTDGFVDAAPSDDGFVALATLGGARRVVALDAAGAVRWATPLWVAREGEAVESVVASAVAAHVAGLGQGGRVVTVAPGRGGDPTLRASCPAPGEDGVSSCGTPLVRGVRCPACGYDAAPDVVALRLARGDVRSADGDGRLACLGDRVVVTADGLVAALGLPRGEALWAFDRGPGLGLRGRRAFVSLHVRADVVEAVTAAGLVVRVDPLDGRPLPPPRPAEPPPEDDPPRALAPAPLVLGWPEGDDALRVGAGRLGPDARPLAPGVVLRGRALVAPVREGLLVVDVRTGDVLGRAPWPFPDDARRRRLAAGPDDLVVAWGPGGVAAFAPGAGEAPADGSVADVAPDAPLEALVAALDATDWRRRLAARGALARREDAAPALRALLEGRATAEAREVARELLVRVERRARWRQLAPGAPEAAIEPLLDRELRKDALEAIAPHVATGPEAASALVALLPAARDREARAVLIDLALRAHEPLCGRVVAIIRNAQANPGLMLAAAEYLVDLARRGLDQPARRALVNPDQLTRAVVQTALLVRGDDAVRERLRPDPAYWEALRKDELVNALGAQLLEVEPDRGALIDELTRSLLP